MDFGCEYSSTILAFKLLGMRWQITNKGIRTIDPFSFVHKR
jgi:hypothetical protein